MSMIGFSPYATITSIANQPIRITTPAPTAIVVPKDESQAGRQMMPNVDYGNHYGVYAGQYFANGQIKTTENANTFGLMLNSLGIPSATYANFDKFREEGMIEIGRAIADAIINNAELVVAAADEDEDSSDEERAIIAERVERIRKTWKPLWAQFLAESAFAKDDGNHSLECVWGHTDNGFQTIVKLEPLSPTCTLPLVFNDSTTFAGVRNVGIGEGGSSKMIDLSPEYCIHMVHESKSGSLYGRSRFLAARRWIYAKWDLQNKLSLSGNSSIGNLFDISFPVSDLSQSDPNYQVQTDANRMQAERIGMAAGKAGYFTRPTLSAGVRSQLVKMGLKPEDLDPWQVTRVDTKDNAFGDFKQAFDVCDEQILIAIKVLPQSVKEGDNSGARAVAKTHTDTMVMMAKPFMLYLSSLLQEKTDLICELNYGKEARGTVSVSGAIDDETLEIVETILTSLLSKDLTTLAKILEIRPLLAKLGMKPREGFDQDKLIADAEAVPKKEVDAKKQQLQASANDDEYAQDQHDRRQRDAFLLALLAFWALQRSNIISLAKSSPGTPISPQLSWDHGLAMIIANYMTPLAFRSAANEIESEKIESTVGKVSLSVKAEVDAASNDLAAKINGVTIARANAVIAGVRADASNVAELYEAGINSTLDDVRDIHSDHVNRIADDYAHAGGQIGRIAAQKLTDRTHTWRITKDEKTCGVCVPLDGMSVPVGTEFRPGIRWPVIDTHNGCRCEVNLDGVAT